MAKTSIPECKLLIGGEWGSAAVGDQLDITNPSTGEIIGKVPLCGPPDVDRAVNAAREAFPAWAHTPVAARTQVMFRFKHLLEAHHDEIARLISLEHGKTYEESRGSLQRGIEVVELACGLPMLVKGETLPNMGGGVDYYSFREPLGVCIGITPFNFPAMIPLWMFPVAITSGNTFILKPSQLTPLTAVRMLELLTEAGLPPGVINLVHGAEEAVNTLLVHPDVKAVSFVGSTPVAEHVYRTATARGKRVQAAGGAKNHFVVMPDAPVEPFVNAALASAFGCAGERCMAVSNIIATEDAAQRFLDTLCGAAAAITIGPTDRDERVDLGPVISAAHLERIHSFIETGLNEGAALIQDGRTVKVDQTPNGYYLGPTIFDQVPAGSTLAQEEIFGPVLSIMRTSDLDAAVEIINLSPYGNAACIFTRSGPAARVFRQRVRCGMVGVNVGVPAPAAFFPFSGWNRSFFGDLHVQGKEGIAFYTQQKVVMSRWV